MATTPEATPTPVRSLEPDHALLATLQRARAQVPVAVAADPAPVTASSDTTSAQLPVAPLVSTSSLQTPVTPSLTPAPMERPLGHPGWNDELGQRIQWMVGRNVQGAQLRLNPAHLGPIEVRISVHNDQASVAFVAQHAVAREALEAALPRLRDMFAESGMTLSEADVSDQQRSGDEEQTARQLGAGEHDETVATGADESGASDMSLRVITSDGLLDLFA